MAKWKQITAIASEMHNEYGISAINKEGEEILSSDKPIFSVMEPQALAGKEITPKSLRKFTWENRKSRALTRDTAIIWTYYDNESDTSFVGVGAQVNPEVIGRVDQGKILRGTDG